MSTEHATSRTFETLRIPKTTNKTVRMRFKEKLFQDAKSNNKTKPSANDVKVAWDKVKHIFQPERLVADKENAHHQLIVFLHEATQEEESEKLSSEKALLEWSNRFNTAAKEHLEKLLREVVDSTSLTVAVAKAEKAVSIWPQSAAPPGFTAALKAAREKLGSLQTATEASSVYASLRGCSNDHLIAHAQEYVAMKRTIEGLKHLEAEKEAAAEKDQKLAATLKPEIYRYLKKQMKYEKNGWGPVEYRRGGVTKEIFQKAFGVEDPKQKIVTLPNSGVDSKVLRYGASLEYESIVAKLQGTDLVVVGKYTMK